MAALFTTVKSGSKPYVPLQVNGQNDVLCTYKGIMFNLEKEDTLKHVTTCMKLENIMLI
jgi:hypothetical protein